MSDNHLLEVKDLCVYFPVTNNPFSKKKMVHAVNHVSFNLRKGETLGIVGESGCGKTTLGRTLLKLIEPTHGQIIFDGVDITHYSARAIKEMRKKMQIIFQDPYAALNPKKDIRFALTEPLDIHSLSLDKTEREKRIHELLSYVQLPSSVLDKHPHEISGGQRQRVCIARALGPQPSFIICDESVSALDVSIQAQIVNLFKDLQKQLSLTYLFIAHDLNVVAYMADRVAVMYLGNIVELGDVEEVYYRSQHPYTKALLSAIPKADPAQRQQDAIKLQGSLPSPITLPEGCHFHPRCWRATEQCRKVYPPVAAIQGHQFRCYHPLQEEKRVNKKEK